MELLPFICSKVSLSPEDKQIIDAAFRRETHPKGTILAHPYNSNQKVLFIEKGLVRTFYNHNDKDITHFFFDENAIATTLDSIFYNKQDQYGMQTLEDTITRTIHYQDFSRILNEIKPMKEFAFLSSIDVIKAFSDRIYSLQFHTAQQRYDALLASNPSLILRVPLGHIASYLGITQQTLSVIRGKK